MHDQIITTANCTTCGRSEDVKKMLLIDSGTLHCTDCKSAHTPAPWHFKIGKSPHYQGQVYNERTSVTIAVTFSHNNKANTRLIAAAPDLLAACREALNCHPYCDCDDEGMIDDNGTKMLCSHCIFEAAISKADPR